jgi:hypothetical protein
MCYNAHWTLGVLTKEPEYTAVALHNSLSLSFAWAEENWHTVRATIHAAVWAAADTVLYVLLEAAGAFVMAAKYPNPEYQQREQQRDLINCGLFTIVNMPSSPAIFCKSTHSTCLRA